MSTHLRACTLPRPWSRERNARSLIPVVTLALSFAAFVSSADAQQIQSIGGGNWSNPAIWQRISGTGALPGAGDEVMIQAGHTVVLDTNSGIQNLAHLIVDGVFRVADTQTYTLGASRVDVGMNALGAVFEVGTTTSPFQNRFELTLKDQFLSSSYCPMTMCSMTTLENKTFMAMKGSIVSMIGRSTNASGATKSAWLRIKDGSNLAAGSNTVFLEANPNFENGDTVVIASTDFDAHQAEVRSVVSCVGNKVLLSSSVGKKHHGKIENTVDERAEVALLNRNIVVRTDPTTLSQRRGAHMMFTGSIAPLVQLERVELRDMGWHGALGRYPIHFHLIGNNPGSFVRACSIHRSFNRALTLHGTNDVLVEDNVAYDHYGHGYYLENGTEVRNTFTHNLGLVTRVPDPAWTGIAGFKLGDIWPVTNQPFFGVDDKEAATFWIMNFDNTFTANAAAGSEAHGYWWKMPSGVPLLSGGFIAAPPRFQFNVAHSNGIHGLFQEDHTIVPVDFTLAKWFETVGTFLGVTSYKNRKAGVWFRAVGEIVWQDCKVADNGFAFYLASQGLLRDFPDYIQPYTVTNPTNVTFYNFLSTGTPGFSSQILNNCTIVGETNNLGNPAAAVELAWTPPRSLPDPATPELMVKGVELYDGLIIMLGCHFENFQDVAMPSPVTAPGGVFTHRASAAISSRGEHSRHVPGNSWAVEPRNAILLSTFTNVAHRVLFPIPHAPVLNGLGTLIGPDGVASGVVYDIDGSLGAGADTYHVNNTPLMRPAGFAAPAPLPNLSTYANPLVLPRASSGGSGDFRIGHMAMTINGPCPPPPVGCLLPLWNVNPASVMSSVTSLRLDSVTRPGNSLGVHHAQDFSQPFLRWFQINLLLDHNGTQEHYRVNYPTGHSPANDPRKFGLDLRFADAGRGAIFEFPFDGGGGAPAAVRFTSKIDPSVVFASTTHATLGAFLGSTGNATFYDGAAKRLYIRAVLQGAYLPWMGSGLLPILSGREIAVEVDG